MVGFQKNLWPIAHFELRSPLPSYRPGRAWRSVVGKILFLDSAAAPNFHSATEYRITHRHWFTHRVAASLPTSPKKNRSGSPTYLRTPPSHDPRRCRPEYVLGPLTRAPPPLKISRTNSTKPRPSDANSSASYETGILAPSAIRPLSKSVPNVIRSRLFNRFSPSAQTEDQSAGGLIKPPVYTDIFCAHRAWPDNKIQKRRHFLPRFRYDFFSTPCNRDVHRRQITPPPARECFFSLRSPTSISVPGIPPGNKFAPVISHGPAYKNLSAQPFSGANSLQFPPVSNGTSCPNELLRLRAPFDRSRLGNCQRRPPKMRVCSSANAI